MKIRNGFVSNSSSSSFILGYKGEFHKVVPKALKELLEKFDLYSSKNVHMLTAKVQENCFENMSDYKRVIINNLQSEADWWFRPLDAYGEELRKKWKTEDPVSYKEQVDRMNAIKENPILVAEQTIQNPETDLWPFSYKLLFAKDFLQEGYKVCTFDLEYSGDYPDENKYPFHKELKRLTDELCNKIGSTYKCEEPIIENDSVKLEKLDG